MGPRNYVEFRDAFDIRGIPDIRRRRFYRQTMLSQFDHSRRMRRLLRDFDISIDPAWNVDAFYRLVFNPRTASGWGLDVWGRIVGCERVVYLRTRVDCLGFHGAKLKPFNHAPFWPGLLNAGTRLGDEAFRLLVFVKAAINITDGSLRDLNRIFHMLFGDRGQVCALHVGTMVMRILMRFPIDDYIRALLTTETMTPIPAGVGWDLYEVPVHTFGFEFSGLKPFNQGAFAREPIHVPSA